MRVKCFAQEGNTMSPAKARPWTARSVVERTNHCLISNREGLGTSLQIMGLAAIDPHSLKVQTKLYKIPKFGVNQATFD